MDKVTPDVTWEISYASTFSSLVQENACYTGLWVLPDTPNPLPTQITSLELGRMVHDLCGLSTLFSMSTVKKI